MDWCTMQCTVYTHVHIYPQFWQMSTHVQWTLFTFVPNFDKYSPCEAWSLPAALSWEHSRECWTARGRASSYSTCQVASSSRQNLLYIPVHRTDKHQTLAPDKLQFEESIDEDSFYPYSCWVRSEDGRLRRQPRFWSNWFPIPTFSQLPPPQRHCFYHPCQSLWKFIYLPMTIETNICGQFSFIHNLRLWTQICFQVTFSSL